MIKQIKYFLIRAFSTDLISFHDYEWNENLKFKNLQLGDLIQSKFYPSKKFKYMGNKKFKTIKFEQKW